MAPKAESKPAQLSTAKVHMILSYLVVLSLFRDLQRYRNPTVALP